MTEPPATRRRLDGPNVSNSSSNESATGFSSKIPRILDGKYFKIVERNNKNVRAQCMTCGRFRKGSICSTGNFMEHISGCHPTLVAEVELHRKVKSNDSTETKQTTLPFVFSPLSTQIVSFLFI